MMCPTRGGKTFFSVRDGQQTKLLRLIFGIVCVALLIVCIWNNYFPHDIVVDFGCEDLIFFFGFTFLLFWYKNKTNFIVFVCYVSSLTRN